MFVVFLFTLSFLAGLSLAPGVAKKDAEPQPAQPVEAASVVLQSSYCFEELADIGNAYPLEKGESETAWKARVTENLMLITGMQDLDKQYVFQPMVSAGWITAKGRKDVADYHAKRFCVRSLKDFVLAKLNSG